MYLLDHFALHKLKLPLHVVVYYVIDRIAKGQWGVVVPPNKNFGDLPLHGTEINNQ